jgi:WD40 repeat protein/tetratricopeptide (TPR) repeat protein
MVRLFDVATGTERFSHAHGAAVHAVAFSPDGKTLVTGSGDGKMKLWDMATGQNPTVLAQPAPVSIVEFSRDGQSLVVAGEFPARILGVANGRELRTLNGFVGPGVLSPDWTTCATWTPDGSVKLADAQTGAEQAVIPRMKQQPEGGWMFAFSPDGKTLATSVQTVPGTSVTLWDLPARRIRAGLKTTMVTATNGGSFSSMAFSPDGKKLAAGTQFNRVRLWDLASGEELILQAHLDSWINSIAFSPDGRTLASGNDRGTVQLWQIDTGRQLPGSFRGHTDRIRGMAFSPDGQTLVTGSDDKTVRFWDVHTGQERMTLTGHTAAVTTMQFAPDGHTLATGGLDGTVRLCHASVDEMATAFRDELDSANVEGPRAANEEGDRLRDSGRHAEAADAYRRALARAEQLMRWHSGVAAYAQESARSYFGLGYLLDQGGEPAEGLDEQRRAIALLDFAEARLATGPQCRSEIARGYLDLAEKLLGQRRFPQAGAAYGASMLLYDKLAAEYPTNQVYQWARVHATGRLASLLAATNRPREALEMFRGLLQMTPQVAETLNEVAWLLATCPEAKIRDPGRAVELTKKAIELAPKEGTYWNTLGVAHYRAGDWKAAIEALTKSMEYRNGGDSADWFFLAMAHWQLGDKTQARSWYDKAVTWMEKYQPKDEELLRFRAEAAALLEVNEKKD